MAGLQRSTAGRVANPAFALIVDRLRRVGKSDDEIEEVLAKLPAVPLTGVTAVPPTTDSPVRLPGTPPVGEPIQPWSPPPIPMQVRTGPEMRTDPSAMGRIGPGIPPSLRAVDDQSVLPRAPGRMPYQPIPALMKPNLEALGPAPAVPGGLIRLPSMGADPTPGIPSAPIMPGGVGFGPGQADALTAMMAQMGPATPDPAPATPPATASAPPPAPGGIAGFLDKINNPDMGRLLLDFGLGTMAAGGQPGATLGGSIGQGGVRALRNADTRKRYDALIQRDERRLALEEAKFRRDPIAEVDKTLDANGHIWATTQNGVRLDLGKKAEGLSIKEKADLMMKQSTDEVAGPLGTVKTFNRESWNKRARDYGMTDLILSGDEKIKVNPATGQRIKWDEKRKTWVDIQTLEPVTGAP